MTTTMGERRIREASTRLMGAWATSRGAITVPDVARKARNIIKFAPEPKGELRAYSKKRNRYWSEISECFQSTCFSGEVRREIWPSRYTDLDKMDGDTHFTKTDDADILRNRVVKPITLGGLARGDVGLVQHRHRYERRGPDKGRTSGFYV